MPTPQWKSNSATVERWLQHWLFSSASGIAVDKEAEKLMRYSLEAPSKLFRPSLYLSCLQALGQPAIHGRLGALALECVHTYSLIHDDLPSMDNDDLRRGRPTSHRRFGEASAILAGDALLTLAFELLGNEPQTVAGKMVSVLAKAAGGGGMVGGQLKDMYWTKRGGAELKDLEALHLRKTGALIAASLELAGVRAHAPTLRLEKLRALGHALGLLFQIRDDILDIESSCSELGKSAGKDVLQDKLTYPALLGLEGARKMLENSAEHATHLYADLGFECPEIAGIIHYLKYRRN